LSLYAGLEAGAASRRLAPHHVATVGGVELMRKASVERVTKETQIRAKLTIEGKGRYQISTGIRFFDHMLELFTKHGGFDLELTATGDLDVDQHHTVEDVGIVLGQCFSQALGDRVGINRAGYYVVPMDETLAVVAVDLGGRPALVYHAPTRYRLVGDLQTELLHDFFDGFVNHAGANLHARVMYGRSNHHKIEGIFKCFARAMRFACSTDARLKDQLPSTKGLLRG
jgi:imidazoleglycerol-phosphate dehydratase